MARSKPKKKAPARKKKAAARRKPAAKRTARRKPSRPATMRRVKPSRRKAASSKKRKKAASKKPKRTSGGRRPRGSASSGLSPVLDARGLGPEAAGQSGDTEGLSRSELADSESVEELLEEGQAFEAGIIEGVENAPDADQGPVRTREVPEDDVPQEYLDED